MINTRIGLEPIAAPAVEPIGLSVLGQTEIPAPVGPDPGPVTDFRVAVLDLDRAVVDGHKQALDAATRDRDNRDALYEFRYAEVTQRMLEEIRRKREEEQPDEAQFETEDEAGIRKEPEKQASRNAKPRVFTPVEMQKRQKALLA